MCPPFLLGLYLPKSSQEDNTPLSFYTQNLIIPALDSGKLAMNKDDALMAVQVLVDNQWRQPVAPDKEQARQYGEYPPAVYEGYEGVDMNHITTPIHTTTVVIATLTPIPISVVVL